jgi:hypothetical protein
MTSNWQLHNIRHHIQLGYVKHDGREFHPQNHNMRNLTPIGKVTVVKTLIHVVVPIITHLLTDLPNPDETRIHEIENSMKLKCTKIIPSLSL